MISKTLNGGKSMPDRDDQVREWKQLSSRVAYRNRFFQVIEDEVLLPTGHRTDFTYVSRQPAVMIVPYTDETQVVMVSQYRHAVTQRCWEFPAGSVHPGEDSFDAARRELLQETGMIAHSLELLHRLFTSNGTSDETISFILAYCSHIEEPNREATEQGMEERAFTLDECMEMLDSGLIKCSSTALALLSVYRRSCIIDTGRQVNDLSSR